jgi:hypothetical protein
MGCDRADAKDLGGNCPIVCLLVPSAPMTTGPEA